MLNLPENGISRSVNVHNSKLEFVCDWIEASLSFSDEEISKSDVVDVLMENEVYDEQDFAQAFVEDVWGVLKRRSSAINVDHAFVWGRDRVRRAGDWKDFPAYAFCLTVTCGSYLYPHWARGHGFGTAEQGSLFERIAVRSIEKMLPGWAVRRVGWAPDNPVRLRDSISEIISSLNEVEGVEMREYVDENANELGLDILAHYPFGDSHSSSVILMIQCASGKDWRDKRHTPCLSTWRKVINFNSSPVKGFAIPYAFKDIMDFRKEATKVDGLFLDRYRLLNPNRGERVVFDDLDLNNDLISWVEPRVAAMPLLDV